MVFNSDRRSTIKTSLVAIMWYLPNLLILYRVFISLLSIDIYRVTIINLTLGLQTEGLYRKSGERAKIRKLLLAFNQDPKGVMIDQDQYTVHDVTGVLKQFFQTLPDPLFTHHLYYPFIDAASK